MDESKNAKNMPALSKNSLDSAESSMQPTDAAGEDAHLTEQTKKRRRMLTKSQQKLLEETGLTKHVLTDERYRYNPKFQFTPEVESILRDFYDDLLAQYGGNITRGDLISYLQHRMSSKFQVPQEHWNKLESGYGHLKPRGESVLFSEFCHIVLQLRDVAPDALEDVYNSWVLEQIDMEESRVLRKRQSISKRPTDFVTVSKSLVAGGLAGAVAKTSIAPFDRVKILFQVSHEAFSLRKAFSTALRIYKNDGLFALWKGNGPAMLRILPYSGVQHASYDQFKRFFFDYNKRHGAEEELTHAQRLMSGAFAGALSVSLTYPFDVLRTRLAVTQGSGRIKLHVFVQDMVKREGPSCLFRGMGTSIIGVLPYGGITFSLNELLKREVALLNLKLQHNECHEAPDNKQLPKLSAITKLACGAFAGLVAQSITYPLEVIRRRIQTAGYIPNTTIQSSRLGIIGTAKQIVKAEGFRRGLFKGLSMNWIKGPIAISISLTTYDILKEVFNVESRA